MTSFISIYNVVTTSTQGQQERATSVVYDPALTFTFCLGQRHLQEPFQQTWGNFAVLGHSQFKKQASSGGGWEQRPTDTHFPLLLLGCVIGRRIPHCFSKNPLRESLGDLCCMHTCTVTLFPAPAIFSGNISQRNYLHQTLASGSDFLKSAR